MLVKLNIMMCLVTITLNPLSISTCDKLIDFQNKKKKKGGGVGGAGGGGGGAGILHFIQIVSPVNRRPFILVVYFISRYKIRLPK